MPTPNYLLKISIQYTRPEIWRRIMIPADFTLDKLHVAIQIAFGWYNSHLHGFFTPDRKHYSPTNGFGIDMMFASDDGLPEEKYTLAELMPEKNSQMIYLYDYGDNWEHIITVENVDYTPKEAVTGPVWCLDGAMAGPPEDCGGIPGFEDFCEAIKDRKHPEHRDMKEWYADVFGGKYNPEKFDAIQINGLLYAVFDVMAEKPARKTARKATKKAVKKTVKRGWVRAENTTEEKPKKKTVAKKTPKKVAPKKAETKKAVPKKAAVKKTTKKTTPKKSPKKNDG